MVRSITDLAREIEGKTLEYGGNWGVNHAKRLLALVDRLSGGAAYDRTILHLAACMHDWGAWDAWKKADTDHAVRSSQIIPEVLLGAGADAITAERVAACALHHHTCDTSAGLEETLLHDADALDFIGAVGVLRNFSSQPKDLRSAAGKARKRIEYAHAHLLLEKSREMARELMGRSERILSELEEESGGLY